MPKAKPTKKVRLHDATFTEQLERSSDQIRPKKQLKSRSADGDEDSGKESDENEDLTSEIDESELKMVVEAKNALEKVTSQRDTIPGGGDGSSDEDYEDDVLEEEDEDIEDLVEFEDTIG